MKIKSLLIGSAAALVAVSGAQAADAVVSMDPEPVGYVEVCSAAGTGYFYMPGTEICMGFGGEVQIDVEYTESSEVTTASTSADFDVMTYADSELGAITTTYDFSASQGGDWDSGSLLIGIGAFTVGYAEDYLDTAGVSTGSGTLVAYDGGDYTVLATFIDTSTASGAGTWDSEFAGSVEFALDPVTLTLAGSYLNEDTKFGVRAAVGDLEVGYNYDSTVEDQIALTSEYGMGDFTFELDYTIDVKGVDGDEEMVFEVTYETALADGLDLELSVAYTDSETGGVSSDDTVLGLSLERSF